MYILGFGPREDVSWFRHLKVGKLLSKEIRIALCATCERECYVSLTFPVW